MRWLRLGLGFLCATQLVVGLWALVLPARFFALDVVGMGMAYNEHLMRDYGAMSLASAVVLGAATLRTRTWLTRTALVMYLTWAVPHLVVHISMIGHLAPSTAALLLTALFLAVALPSGLLLLALRLPEKPSPGVHTGHRGSA
ncbi:hypothetical protein BAY61_22155 [Prauserella marina]|uniref:Uncharacterized protein n=1 Tax=Prauserella marina TaxID=530584 RepID=A0A222VU76_9PSEU|nr:hypothetical protein [Prauserella marina]ASR37251.1 hypothetical protein BAY61_22155 [Prauserella marina]PWV72580.1 hypothetical protein DES30_110180 [Prauserella marina]SDD76694.1 hypothetical protein SAMN05421630_11258 [Prauserella marina]